MVSDDLATIFNDVAQEIEPDLAAVIDAATSRGRRMMARRRIAIALSAGATVLVVVAATTLGTQLAGRPAQGSRPASPGGHRSVEPKPPHHRAVAVPVPQEHGPGMTQTQMLAVLRTLLPAGDVTDVIPYLPRGGVEVNFDDGQGAVDIVVEVSPTVPPVRVKPGASRLSNDQAVKQERRTEQLYCPNPPLTDEGKRPAGALPISCTRTVLADGEIVMKEITEADVAGYYDLAVYVARPDGVTVSIDVGNGTLEGTPHEGRQYWPWVDRAVPPGDFGLWEQLVQSPKWHL